MKKFKKLFAITLMICSLFSMSACSKKKETAVLPLTYLEEENSDNLYTHNYVNTEEGVVIMCSNNYILGPEARGQFVFELGDSEITKFENDKEEDIEWTVSFVSNGQIYKIDYFDYKGNVIASEKCKGLATVTVDYNGNEEKYIDSIILYIQFNGKKYTAEFARTGA